MAVQAGLLEGVDEPFAEGSPAISDDVVYMESFDGKVFAFAAGSCGAALCPPLWADDSGGQFAASGSWKTGDATVTWSGLSLIKPKQYGSPGDNNFIWAFGSIDVGNKSLRLALMAIALKGMTFVETGPGGTATGDLAESTGRLDGSFSSDFPIPAVQISLEDDFSIPAGQRSEPDQNGGTLLNSDGWVEENSPRNAGHDRLVWELIVVG